MSSPAIQDTRCATKKVRNRSQPSPPLCYSCALPDGSEYPCRFKGISYVETVDLWTQPVSLGFRTFQKASRGTCAIGWNLQITPPALSYERVFFPIPTPNLQQAVKVCDVSIYDDTRSDDPGRACALCTSSHSRLARP